MVENLNASGLIFMAGNVPLQVQQDTPGFGVLDPVDLGNPEATAKNVPGIHIKLQLQGEVHRVGSAGDGEPLRWCNSDQQLADWVHKSRSTLKIQYPCHLRGVVPPPVTL